MLIPDSNLTCRNSIYMPSDGRYRTVPSVLEVEGYLLDAALAEDLARFVPVVERVVGGRKVLSVIARDMHMFVGGSYEFPHWFRQQVSSAQLTDGKDYERLSEKNFGKSVIGRPRVDFVVTLSAAKEIGMLDRGGRGKQMRLYFIDCEAKVLASALPHELHSGP